MPDNERAEVAPPAPALPTPDQPKLSQEAAAAVKDASAGVGKKILFWVLGIFGVIAAIVILVVTLGGKGKLEGVKEAIQSAKDASARADTAAKLKIAEAKSEEAAVIKKIREIKEMDDEDKQLEELNKLL